MSPVLELLAQQHRQAVIDELLQSYAEEAAELRRVYGCTRWYERPAHLRKPVTV